MISYTGKQIRLRPLRRSDKDRFLKWRNDPDVRDHALGIRFPITEKMEEEWLEKAMDDRSNTRVVFAIETLKEQELIGLIHLNRIDWVSRLSYCGIMIGEKSHYGKGIAPEATTILLNYAFNILNLRKVVVEVASFNKRSIRVTEKLGFRQEGCLRENVYLEGKYHDLILLGLLKSEFSGSDQSPAWSKEPDKGTGSLPR